MIKRFPFFMQLNIKDCGPASLQIISRYYVKYFYLDEIRERCEVTKEWLSVYDLCKAAELLGFKIPYSIEELNQESNDSEEEVDNNQF